MEDAIIELIANKLYVTVDLDEDYMDRLTVKVTLSFGEYDIVATETCTISKPYCTCGEN